jgi:aryl-alcohol dehydrogenase-like predicted oxidoreductase
MEHVTLGRTGLRVSVAGLGTGGFSRLGLGTGGTEADAIAVVRLAHELGVTLFDTATAYGTQAVLGTALKPLPRGSVVITTKTPMHRGNERLTAVQVVAALDASLRDLQTDYVDVFQLHGVPPSMYDYAQEKIIPAVMAEKKRGKFRHFGISETAPNDTSHSTLRRGVEDDLLDVVMVAFHMLHQNARTLLFPQTRAKKIGTMLMYAVRGIFTHPDRVAEAMRELAAAGQVPPELAAEKNPLGFLIHAAGASSLTDAAYRFVRHEPGVDVVLFGTGNQDHLRANIASILKPPLPAADREKLASLFGHLVGVGLERPAHATPPPS